MYCYLLVRLLIKYGLMRANYASLSLLFPTLVCFKLIPKCNCALCIISYIIITIWYSNFLIAHCPIIIIHACKERLQLIGYNDHSHLEKTKVYRIEQKLSTSSLHEWSYFCNQVIWCCRSFHVQCIYITCIKCLF